MDASTVPRQPVKTLFGQPRGLATLFLTEMWERFTYYGMRAILVLFMVGTLADGGLGIGDKTASSIYGLFVAGSYLFSILGGWIADTLIGAQRAVVAGGVFIMVGNAMLASGTTQVFFLGLTSITFGVGLLKPNISAMVANLYPEGGSRRDAGFSLFYMGINVGALLGALLVPICAMRFGWHWGFALPAAGMFLGLVQFLLTRHYLSASGLRTPVNTTLRSWLPVIGFLLAVVIAATLAITGAFTIDPQAVATAASWLIGVLAAGCFGYLVFFAGLSGKERNRVYVMTRSSSPPRCTTRPRTDRHVAHAVRRTIYRPELFGWQVPAGIFQGVSSVFIILFAPLFSALWLGLEKRGKDLSTPVEVRGRSDLDGPRLLGDVLRVHLRDGRPESAADLAGAVLHGADVGRSVPCARGPLLHDQARTPAARRAGDGYVVPVRLRSGTISRDSSPPNMT